MYFLQVPSQQKDATDHIQLLFSFALNRLDMPNAHEPDQENVHALCQQRNVSHDAVVEPSNQEAAVELMAVQVVHPLTPPEADAPCAEAPVSCDDRIHELNYLLAFLDEDLFPNGRSHACPAATVQASPNQHRDGFLFTSGQISGLPVEGSEPLAFGPEAPSSAGSGQGPLPTDQLEEGRLRGSFPGQFAHISQNEYIYHLGDCTLKGFLLSSGDRFHDSKFSSL